MEPGRLASWIRQGFGSLIAAQKILLDLTAQQNALAIGVVRERFKLPQMSPGGMLVGMADQGVASFAEAGNVLLDLAAGETAVLTEAVKGAFGLGPAGATATDVARLRVDSFIEMHRRLLETVSEQMKAVSESYEKGKGLMLGTHAAQLARTAIEGFVETEKKFLATVEEEVAAAVAGERGQKPVRHRAKLLTQLAHDAAGQYIDAQKKLLDLAIRSVAAERAAAAKLTEGMEEEEPQTTLADVTEKTVKNFVAAETMLLDLVKHAEKHATAAPRPKARRKKAAAKAAAS